MSSTRALPQGRARTRVHPAGSRTSVWAADPDGLRHVDATVTKILDGARAFTRVAVAGAENVDAGVDGLIETGTL